MFWTQNAKSASKVHKEFTVCPLRSTTRQTTPAFSKPTQPRHSPLTLPSTPDADSGMAIAKKMKKLPVGRETCLAIFYDK
jgi:hypothetical protein